MTNGVVGAVLWFVVLWFAYEVLWSITGVPREFGPIAALTAAILLMLGRARQLAGFRSARVETPLKRVPGGHTVL